MMGQQIRRPRWLLNAFLLFCTISCCVSASFENKTGLNENNSPRVFSPRMDYDEWTPLGRGDPLKNDPTFDYVPPILDRVQYWMDSQTTEASAKSDILVLGVTAKKTSPKIPEHFLKFVNGPKFTRNQEHQGSYITEFTGSRGAEPPKLIRKTQFRNGIKDYRNQERLESIPASYYPSTYYNNEHSKPDTMMLPPPVLRNPEVNRPHQPYGGPMKNQLYSDKHRFSTQTEAGPILHLKHQIYDHQPPQNPYSLPDTHQPKSPPRKHHTQISSDRQKLTTKETSVSHIETIKSYTPSSDVPVTQYRYESTSPSVSSEKSNLIYQSSQTISDGWLAKTRPPATIPSLIDLESVTWQTDDASSNNNYNSNNNNNHHHHHHHHYEEDVHQAAGSSHHEVVLGPNANIIVEGDSSDKEEIVIGQKEKIPPPSEQSSDVTMEGEQDEDADAFTAPESNSENMYIVIANSSPSSETDKSKKESAVTVVMPENFSDEDIISTTTEEINEELTQTTSIPLDNTHMASEMEKPEEKPMLAHHHHFSNVLAHPQAMAFMNDAPAAPSHMPPRIAMPYQQTLTHHGPHGDSKDSSPQRVVHHQPSHARPAQLMTHYGPHIASGMGMNFRETLPPSHIHSGMPMAHMKQNMRHVQMPPFKTMTMAPPPGMANKNLHNQPHRFYQHQFPQMVPTTMTSNSANSFNGIRDLILKDEAHRNFQKMTEIIETTTAAMPSIVPNDVAIFSNVNMTENKNRLQPDMQKDEDSRRNIVSTTEQTTVQTPTTASVIPTTTTPTLTTDPIFSHYKQPANPLRGPMYLIIQGHSKVKTYKPWVDKHGNQVDNFESTTSKQISEFEKFVNKENTRKIADAEKIKEDMKTTERPKEQAIGQDSLLSFIDSGLGAFPMPSYNHELDGKNPNLLTAAKDD